VKSGYLMPSVKRKSSITIEPSSELLEPHVAEQLLNRVELGYCEGKLPLFVIGAGISKTKVPSLWEMADALLILIEKSNVDELTRRELLRQGELLKTQRATRSDAAEFFSTLQVHESSLEQVWNNFCKTLVNGGLILSDPRPYAGLLKLGANDCSDAHIDIAAMLSAGCCHVLNLNYDPLLYLAQISLTSDEHELLPLISLHSPGDIRAYYTSPERQTLQPAVTNARGDVFYAKCTNIRCPRLDTELTLEFRPTPPNADIFFCPSCHQQSIRLQLSFPSFETKEKLVQPLINELRQYIGFQTSALIAVGISGQWDPYLLNALFGWAYAYGVPLLDVKPAPSDRGLTERSRLFEAFRHRFFPGVSARCEKTGSCYVRIENTADVFASWLKRELVKRLQLCLPDIRRTLV
jgi:hypothetical protein